MPAASFFANTLHLPEISGNLFVPLASVFQVEKCQVGTVLKICILSVFILDHKMSRFASASDLWMRPMFFPSVERSGCDNGTSKSRQIQTNPRKFIQIQTNSVKSGQIESNPDKSKQIKTNRLCFLMLSLD